MNTSKSSEVKKWHCPWCHTEGIMKKDEFVKLPVSGNFMVCIPCTACGKNSFYHLSVSERAEHKNLFTAN